MVLLSVRAGLRAKEIACLKWGMVTDAEGQVGDALHLDNNSSKGSNGGRTIPLHAELRAALVALKEIRTVDADDRVIFSERTIGMSPIAVQVWFHRHYAALGFVGASSHSGRRTFVTTGEEDRRGRWVVAGRAGAGWPRDPDETTQRYIQGSNDAKRRVMGLI